MSKMHDPEPVGEAIHYIIRALDRIVELMNDPATYEEVAEEERALWTVKCRAELLDVYYQEKTRRGEQNSRWCSECSAQGRTLPCSQAGAFAPFPLIKENTIEFQTSLIVTTALLALSSVAQADTFVQALGNTQWNTTNSGNVTLAKHRAGWQPTDQCAVSDLW